MSVYPFFSGNPGNGWSEFNGIFTARQIAVTESNIGYSYYRKMTNIVFIQSTNKFFTVYFSNTCVCLFIDYLYFEINSIIYRLFVFDINTVD